LRAPLAESFARSDAFILIGKDTRNATALLPANKPLFHASIQPLVPETLDLAKPVVAFAGLGRPEKFYQMLAGLGARLARWHPFPDHHAYSARDIAALAAEAKKNGAQLVTTEKDAVRLNGSGLAIQTIPIRLHFENPAEVLDFLKATLKLAA
jgi:tetraacyldisaccharide 4'-kinase